jgi:hypothetical protein
MHFGDLITILEDGIRVSEEELEPIGIVDGSTGWAVWLPDLRALADKSRDPRPSHLIVSPFAVSAWPILVRVELKVDDKRGAMSAATKILRDEGLNILAIDGTPTGHHHATLNIIGEALPIKAQGAGNILSHAAGWDARDRHFNNSDIWTYCCKTLAPEMLRYTAKLTQSIVDANCQEKEATGHGFLREAFFDSKRVLRGVLYGHEDLPADVAELGKVHAATAVQCTWLQELAFFWVYHTNRDNGIRFSYDARTSRLFTALPADTASFRAEVSSFSPPFKSITAINSFEQYMRVTLSQADRWGQTVRVTIPFEATFAEKQNTLGFQHEICKHLEDRFNLRKVSISTQELSDSREKGELTLLLSTSTNAPVDQAAMAEISSRVECAAKNIGEHISVHPTVSRLGARRLFLSAKYVWLSRSDPRYRVVRDLAAFHGFELVDARSPSSVQGFPIRTYENITETAIRLMQCCDAVLQIIPIVAKDELQWLLFESGAARALARPTVLCVECRDSAQRELETTVSSWQQALSVAQGTLMIPFYSRSYLEESSAADSDSKMPTFEQALDEALDLLQTETKRRSA